MSLLPVFLIAWNSCDVTPVTGWVWRSVGAKARCIKGVCFERTTAFPLKSSAFRQLPSFEKAKPIGFRLLSGRLLPSLSWKTRGQCGDQWSRWHPRKQVPPWTAARTWAWDQRLMPRAALVGPLEGLGMPEIVPISPLKLQNSDSLGKLLGQLGVVENPQSRDDRARWNMSWIIFRVALKP